MDLTFQSGVTRIVGPDAGSFLQSLLSNDMDVLADGETQPSLLLNASGKTIATMWVHRLDGETYLLVSEAFTQSRLMEALQKLCIRTKATIEDISTSYVTRVLDDPSLITETDIVLEENHCGVDGVSLCIHLSVSVDSFDASRKLYENFRVRKGAVSVEWDLGEDSIAQEAALDARAVSFTKGCFIGQELVCRIDSRGANTPSTYYAFSVPGDHAEDGEIILDGEKIGIVTSLVVNTELFGIAKISRKGVAALERSDNIPELSIGDAHTPLTSIAPVQGYFSC